MSRTPRENLLPGLSDPRWSPWSPREALRPVFSRGEADGQATLAIDAGAEFRRYGAWQCDPIGVAGGEGYSFDVEYRPTDVADEGVSIHVLLSWIGGDGRMLTREYADRVLALADGWRRACLTTEASSGAAYLRVELALRWTAGGSVLWRRPWLSTAERVPHRKIRVATTFLQQRYNRAENLEAVSAILDRAGVAGCDIVVLSETFVDRGSPSPEPVPGELTGMVSGKAAAHGMYVVFAMNEADGECRYNSAVLIDRKGGIVGAYRKTHLPLVEAEAGVTPGSLYPVFQTDFGTVGMLVCWDHWFPETARMLRAAGAEIILVSTIGDAPLQSAARAADNGIPVVVAGADGEAPSRVVDADGLVIGEVTSQRDDVCIREIDLDQKRLRHWFSVGDADGEPRSILLKERRTDTYRGD
jgi:predicted amidohydrolase